MCAGRSLRTTIYIYQCILVCIYVCVCIIQKERVAEYWPHIRTRPTTGIIWDRQHAIQGGTALRNNPERILIPVYTCICLCVCIYTSHQCMYVCQCIITVCVWMYVCIISVYVRVCQYIISVYTCMCLWVCLCVCMCVCVSIYMWKQGGERQSNSIMNEYSNRIKGNKNTQRSVYACE